jgi:two-component system, chemotaxis family, chemotaxis protein CheY
MNILTVDDSRTMRDMLRLALVGAGFNVVAAVDGEHGLEVLSENGADVIITDINMPKLDGIGLIREARKLLRFTPILALTTESQQAKRDEAKKNGATGWLVKPVGGAELVKVIKQVLPGA